MITNRIHGHKKKYYVQTFEYLLNTIFAQYVQQFFNLTLIYLNALTTHQKRRTARASLFKSLSLKCSGRGSGCFVYVSSFTLFLRIQEKLFEYQRVLFRSKRPIYLNGRRRRPKPWVIVFDFPNEAFTSFVSTCLFKLKAVRLFPWFLLSEHSLITLAKKKTVHRRNTFEIRVKVTLLNDRVVIGRLNACL